MSSESTISFADFTFLSSKGCIACKHILHGRPVCLFVHEADGDLQFLCGSDGHQDDDAVWLHASHVVDLHPDILDLPRVAMGYEAERVDPDHAWIVSKIPQDD